jgi:predicted dehydrogenase
MKNFQTIDEYTESNASGKEGLKDLKVIEAIYKSIESGTKVKV